MAAGNELIDFLGKQKLDKESATAEIRLRLEGVINDIGSLGEERLPKNIISARGRIEENIGQLEADNIVSSIIILARQAEKEHHKLLIPIETDWIPGFAGERSFQKDAISNLIREIDDLPRALRSMGLDNVEVIHKGNKESVEEWANRIKGSLEDQNDYSNVVAFASEKTIDFLEANNFNSIENIDKRPFLAKVNPDQLNTYYREEGHDMGLIQDQLDIQILEMLSMTLELALGKNVPDKFAATSYGITVLYDRQNKKVIFIPDARQIDYESLVERYRAREQALQSA